MEFRQLKTFRTVAETLNFTKAAEMLCLAQSSVSAQIKALEDDLQVKLFDRIGKKVLLTEAGETLNQYAGRLESMTDEIRGVLGQEKLFSGELVIRVPDTIATVYFPEILKRFHEVCPKVGLKCIHCSDAKLSQELNSGRVDLAFLITDYLSISNVQVECLKEEQLVVAVSSQQDLFQVGMNDLSQLEGETLLLPRTD